MVDAVSLSGNSYRAASNALEMRAVVPSAESRPASRRLPRFSQPQPITQVATPSDIAEDIGDLSFLYAPNGLPGASAALPSYAVSPAQATTDEWVTAERNSGARLAIDSSDLNSLMSSFLTARTPSANPTPSPDVPAQQGNAEFAQAARQSVIAQIYNQF